MKTQEVMSELLKSLGFGTMSKSVLTVTDKNQLSKYAVVIVKNSPKEIKQSIATKLQFLIDGL